MRESDLHSMVETSISSININLEIVNDCLGAMQGMLPDSRDGAWVSDSNGDNRSTPEGNNYEQRRALGLKARQHLEGAESSINQGEGLIQRIEAPLENARANAGGALFGRAPGYGSRVQDAGSAYLDEARILTSLAQRLTIAVHDGRSRIAELEKRLQALLTGAWPPDPTTRAGGADNDRESQGPDPRWVDLQKDRLQSRLEKTSRRFSPPPQKGRRRF